MDILLPKFFAIVIGLFLSPALPEDMIKVGDPCEKAMAVVHKQGLRLMDKEFVPRVTFGGPILELAQPDVAISEPLGVLSLSYDRSDSYFPLLGKQQQRTKAGFLLCALATERDTEK